MQEHFGSTTGLLSILDIHNLSLDNKIYYESLRTILAIGIIIIRAWNFIQNNEEERYLELE